MKRLHVLNKGIFIIAALLLCIAVAACSSGGANGSEVKNEATPASGVKETASSPAYKIGVSMPAATHGWTGAMVSYTKDALAEHKEADASVLASADADKQIQDIRSFIEQKVDLILVAPHNDTVAAAVGEAFDAGIKVVVFDRSLPTDKYSAYISGDNKGTGLLDGQALIVHYQKSNGEVKGNVLELKGVDAQITDIRRSGFLEAVKDYPGIQLIDGGFTDYLRDKGYELTKKALESGVVFDAIYSHDDEISIGAIKAIREAKKENDIVIVASGGMKEIYQMMINNEKPVTLVSATYSPLMGKTAVDFAVKMVKGEPLEGNWVKGEGKSYIIQPQAVTPDNVKEFYNPNALY